MGKTIVREMQKQGDLKLVAAIDAPGTPFEGKDMGELAGIGQLGVQVQGADKLGYILDQTKPEVLVDFTVAEAAVENVKQACKHHIDVVVGTTGFKPEQLEEIKHAVRASGVRAVISPNMAYGVNMTFKLLEEFSPLLKDYDIEIVEAHHAKKKDAPSGTALKMAEIIQRKTGRKPQVHSIRAGEIVGDHMIIFAGPGERLEIVHRAQGREAFAHGLFRVIRLLKDKGKPGQILSTLEIF